MLQLIRDYEETLGKIDSLAVCDVGNVGVVGMIVTAMRDGDGNLRLIAWQAGQKPDDSLFSVLTRKETAVAHAISDVAIVATSATALHRNVVVTAVRTQNDGLKLIAWGVSKDGVITRKGSSAEKPYALKGRVAITAFDNDLLVTAAWLPAVGVVRFNSWRLQDDAIESLHQTDVASAGDHAALVSTSWQAVAALRDEKGNLKLICWGVDKDGNFKPQDTMTAGHVDEVTASRFFSEGIVTQNTSDIIVTAVRSGANLKLLGWQVANSTDGKISFVDSTDLPAIGKEGKVAVTTVGVTEESRRLVTGVRDIDGNLALTVWTDDTSQLFVKEASNSGGAVSDLAVTNFGDDYLATALRLADGKLKVITWHTHMT
jgi:hypothetical protein